ncbi:MAG: hypothetical protein ACLSWY_09865 [Ruthenibacterium lactatiformans]
MAPTLRAAWLENWPRRAAAAGAGASEAYVSPTADIRPGAVVLALAAVGACAVVEQGAIVNMGRSRTTTVWSARAPTCARGHCQAGNTVPAQMKIESGTVLERGAAFLPLGDSMSKLLILGAGGLARWWGSGARRGNWDGVAFLDDAVRGADVAGKCMDYTSLTGEYPEAVAAFGDNRLRLAWTRRLLDAGYRVPSVVHPTAIVSPSAVLGPGCLVLHGAIINTNTALGAACLVNSGALVDHDNVLEDGVRQSARHHQGLVPHGAVRAPRRPPCCIPPADTLTGWRTTTWRTRCSLSLGETASYVNPSARDTSTTPMPCTWRRRVATSCAMSSSASTRVCLRTRAPSWRIFSA